MPSPSSESKTLILVRHAKSAWNTGASSDFERPLNRRGERDAPRMGNWLADQGIAVGRIVSSPAFRARQTALAILTALQQSSMANENSIEWDESMYLANAGYLQRVASQALHDTDCVMLVGHNPGMEHCLMAYCDDLPYTSQGKLMTTANIAIVKFADHAALQRQDGRLLVLQRPKQLE